MTQSRAGRKRKDRNNNPAPTSRQFSLFCFESYQPTGGIAGAEVAGTTIPEHGHTGISAHTAQVETAQKGRIESLPQLHRSLRFSHTRSALVKKTCRGDIACGKPPIATRQKLSDLCSGKGRQSWRFLGFGR